MTECTNVYSPLIPDWVTDQDGIGYDGDFWTIIKFFLLHSLCDGQSWKKHRLHDTYLWKLHPWNPPSYLKDRLIKAIWQNDAPQLHMAKTHGLFAGKIDGKNLDVDFADDSSSQRVCFVKVSNGKNNDSAMMGLFYHIRNGLAHGRYGIKPLSENDYMIFLEDGKRRDDQFEVTARIALKKSSLLAIREIIIEGPDEDPNYAEEIVESIYRGNKTKNKIMKDLDITESIWKRESHKLKDAGKILYEKNKWKVIPVL